MLSPSLVSLAYIAGLVGLIVFFLFFLPWVLRWLWNITMPQVFNLPQITFWQAFRIFLISTILFGGIRLH
ncbi:MAG: hypothetical protein FH756_01150 [Firmicutes bacterium]|nr:hypothetical protein [Bacillota bacterium]